MHNSRRHSTRLDNTRYKTPPNTLHITHTVLAPYESAFYVKVDSAVLFRYQEGGSKKLNACSSSISCMVYFLPEHRNLIIYRTYITIFTHHIMPHSTQPLAPCYSVFTYLENKLFCSWWQILIHSCPWSAINCPTHC